MPKGLTFREAKLQTKPNLNSKRKEVVKIFPEIGEEAKS